MVRDGDDIRLARNLRISGVPEAFRGLRDAQGQRCISRRWLVSLYPQDPNIGNTPLHVSAELGHLETSRVLVEYGGAFADTANDLGELPIHKAARLKILIVACSNY